MLTAILLLLFLLIIGYDACPGYVHRTAGEEAIQQVIINSILMCQAFPEDTESLFNSACTSRADFSEPVTFFFFLIL